MQLATSTYNTVDNTRLVPLASLQANFAQELKRENNTLPAKLWVVTMQGELWAIDSSHVW